MAFTTKQNLLFQAAISHEDMKRHIRMALFNLTGQFPGGQGEQFPGVASDSLQPIRDPLADGPNRTDQVYAPLEVFARTLAGSHFAKLLSWSDFSNGWQERFTTAAYREMDEWGVEDQITAVIDALVETGLMRLLYRRNLTLVRQELQQFAKHFILLLSAYRLGLDPDQLLQFT